MGGGSFETTDYLSGKILGRGLTGGLTDVQLTTGAIKRPSDDKFSIFYQDALSGINSSIEDTHKATGFTASFDLHLDKLGVEGKAGRSSNVTFQYQPIEASYGKNFAKTAYGLAHGISYLISSANNYLYED